MYPSLNLNTLSINPSNSKIGLKININKNNIGLPIVDFDFCSKKKNVVDGGLARGRVSEDLQEKFTKFPLKIIHKFVPNMKEIILEADAHPNKTDFLLVKDFIDKNFNN